MKCRQLSQHFSPARFIRPPILRSPGSSLGGDLEQVRPRDSSEGLAQSQPGMGCSTRCHQRAHSGVDPTEQGRTCVRGRSTSVIASALHRIREFRSSDSNRQFPILVAGDQTALKAMRAYSRLGHENREMQRASIQARPVRRSAAPKSRVEQHWLLEDAQRRAADPGDRPERQCEGLASGDPSRPPQTEHRVASPTNPIESNPPLPTPPQALIPAFGQKKLIERCKSVTSRWLSKRSSTGIMLTSIFTHGQSHERSR